MDAAAHPIISRIRDAARYLGSIIPNVKSGTRLRHDRASPRAWREASIPQRMNKLIAAHSAIKDGLKYLIKRRSARYKKCKEGHDLIVQLDQLRTVSDCLRISLQSCRYRQLMVVVEAPQLSMAT